jgi:predicted TIM-barrel fold metal-dependent hydrolase
MTTSNTSPRRRTVDADAHIDPPHSFWRDYLPERLRSLAPSIEIGGPEDDCDFIVFEGKKRPIMMINNQAGRDGKNFKMKGRLSELRDTSSPEKRIADMDLDGMNAAILFGGGPLGTTNSELFIESYRSYYRWLADFCSIAPKRLIGVAYMPMRDIDETIGMIKEAAKLGFRSINLPAFPQAADGISSSAKVANISAAQGAALTGDPSSKKSYAHAEYDRLWAVICDLDMTVTFHLGGRIPRFGEKEHFLPDLVMSKVAMAEPVAIAIYGGIFQRFPKMRWAIIESGVGWMAWMAEYMDRTWEKQRYWVDSVLTEKPSFFMDRNVFASFINDRTGILQRNLPGGRNIMWSSDYPHSETTFPHSHDVIARDFVDIPEADIDAIICTRAAKLFDVPMPNA